MEMNERYLKVIRKELGLSKKVLLVRFISDLREMTVRRMEEPDRFNRYCAIYLNYVSVKILAGIW